MCNKLPGARCANHVSKSLSATQNKLQRAQAKVASIETSFTVKKEEGKAITDTERRRWFDLQDRIKDYSSDIKTFQRQYDATKTGQRVLREKILAASSSEQREMLKGRLRQGILLKSFHDAAVEKERSGETVLMAA